MILLHFTGRKTGTHYEVPVMKQNVDGRTAVFTEARWRVNFRGGADIEVTDNGVRTRMRAELDDDPDSMAEGTAELLNRVGVKGARKLGIVINVDRMPTHEELADAARRRNQAVIYLTPL
ncbi:hypothetical protein Ssi02_09310 [Sinosporangium siamense]|uniref:Uncharacterized protein n=2 Tax=Sinosporangium siamense TaxID=1367973 RepID=A0A919RB61_9ACTN|nr:hypothetical protein Ssi02_09310 [Sinosporangium siamense]